jgi:putative Holliday junction resolvase
VSGRLLGIDLGDRRIGLAIGEPDSGHVRPLSTIRRTATPAGDAHAVRRAIEGIRVTEIICGLPLEANGSEGSQARATRAWSEAFAPAIGLPLALRDERLTTHVAESRAPKPRRGRSGGPPTRAQREGRRALIDRLSAAVILEDELAARRAEGSA